MERMLEKLRDVTSFRFKTSGKDTTIWPNMEQPGTERPVTLESRSTVWWTESNAMREEGRIVRYDSNTPPDEREPEQLVRYEHIRPPGNCGIVVDHVAKTVLRVPEFDGNFSDLSPAATLRKVREQTGKIVRELGSKEMGGRKATGFVMKLDDAPEGSGYDALEVWIDSETDLPIEFSFERRKDNYSGSFRLYDCQWNGDFDKRLFEPNPPKGYTDVTPPQNEKEVEEILEALRLYADLNGGRYPAVSQLKSKELKNEMLKPAGFTGPLKQAWLEDAKYQRIEKALPGFDSLRRITLDRARVGYYGKTVTSRDGEKVLLRWAVKPHAYRVVYGDLRTELVNIGSRGEPGHSGLETVTIAPGE